MGGFLQRMAAKIALAVLGLVLWMGHVTLCDGGDAGEYREVAELPGVVFGGGGGRLEIDVHLNQPGELNASFERLDEVEEETSIGSSQSLAPGDHRFDVDVADATYGYFEVGIPDASVGARIEWSVSLDGETLDSQEIELEEPLQPGHAFFVQLEFDDVAQLRQFAQR
jgi:hypothetical protein